MNVQRYARSKLRCAGVVLTAASLGGCAALDPMYKAGEWHPSGANTVNLVAMVANPADLVHGVGVAGNDGVQAATAVARLRQGTVKTLPDSGLAEVRLQSAGDTPSAPAPTAGGS